jgi:3',5'-cyclic AMP phosphodiesterase CpdA
MRLAIVSDIHGNLTALEAVIADIERRAVDRVIHGGDLAAGGCRAAEVVDLVRQLGWPGIVGNTDELLWRPEEREVQVRNAPKLSALLRLLFDEYAGPGDAGAARRRASELDARVTERAPGAGHRACSRESGRPLASTAARCRRRRAQRNLRAM